MSIFGQGRCQSYSATVQATGGTTPYTWSIASGALPPGLILGASTGTISGTPTTASTYPFTVAVTDSSTPAQTASNPLSILVNPAGPAPLTITTTSLPAGTVNQSYSAPVQATGGTTLHLVHHLGRPPVRPDPRCLDWDHLRDADEARQLQLHNLRER